MPSEMASQRPCRRASYSASLLDTSKRIWKTYLSCSPFGEMKSTPAPPPPNFNGGVGTWFSLYSARKSTRAWDLIAVLGVNFSSSAPSSTAHFEIRPVASRLCKISPSGKSVTTDILYPSK